MRLRPLTILILATLAVLPPCRLSALLNLGIHNTGLSIGNSRRWDGVRINFRDSRVERVRWVNVTLWTPADHAYYAREIDGLAIGLSPAGRNINGIGVGLGGV